MSSAIPYKEKKPIKGVDKKKHHRETPRVIKKIKSERKD
jgi:hypothetical protein